MDINTVRGIATILVMLAFLGVVLWAYSSYKKKDFDEAAQLPFDDETEDEKAARVQKEEDARSNKK
ncbi:MAG TPA: cbb3-type cytochrome c oxidase subunit 3 [Pseudomonas xinjiangensis]|uniref:Cbb3-type cytochrome c oxidase subunit 3 n=2 Tax=root TaxID=1 RepID=A0A7V1FT22_9GAMM|nr:cbb3-type cytochrome c oxidase subunit 3 [Halopseudomonas xinjiangensis]HEC47224.1 cbb3-type cytochrome c oxidase subunit 3 [Halopseudomonas xinjiangensis]